MVSTSKYRYQDQLVSYTFLVMQVSMEYAPKHMQLYISQIRLAKV